MTISEARVRAIVREEIRKAQLPRRERSATHCGRDGKPPQCDGSANRGWEYCVCPGVRVEYYR
jgi:hypothetical protein